MKIDHYENIAKIIVRANELKNAERSSAEKDYGDYVRFVSAEPDVKIIDRSDITSAGAYSAYLQRAGNAEKTGNDFVSGMDTLRKKTGLAGKIQSIMANMRKNDMKLQNAYKEYEAAYERQRDEKDDYYYDLKNEMQKEYNASKKKSTSSKKRKSSYSSKSSSAEKNVKKYAATFENMPSFKSYSNPQEGLAADIYADAFREKALTLSMGGTKKADINELNRLIKMAKEYGADDTYLQWLSSVCGY